MHTNSCPQRIKLTSQHIRRRTIWRIHSCKACGSWSIPSKLLPIAILIRTAARFLREPHTTARCLLAVLAGHEAVRLEAATSTCSRRHSRFFEQGAVVSHYIYLTFRSPHCNRQTFDIFYLTNKDHRTRPCLSIPVKRTYVPNGVLFHYSFLRIFTAFQAYETDPKEK